MHCLSHNVTRLLIVLALTIGIFTLAASGRVDFLIRSITATTGIDKDATIMENRPKRDFRHNLHAATGKAGNARTSLNAANSSLVTETKLIASDGAPGNNLGSAVAVSGNTAVVGDDNSVYVFVRSNGIWAQQQKLSPAGSKHIAIDGNTFVAAGGNIVTVFVRNEATWTQQQLITLDSSIPVSSVAISGDTIVIGTPTDREGCPATSLEGRGAALVYVRNGNLWAQQQKLTASDGQCGYQTLGFDISAVIPYTHHGDKFGYSVSISGDAILVGAYAANTGNNLEAGAAYIFSRSSGTWIERQKLLASDVSSNDYFGFSVAISDDTAVIGAIGSAGALANPNQPGSAYVFGRSSGTWTQQQQFAAGVAPNCFYNFGGSVAVSGDVIVVSCNCDLPPASPVSPPNPLGSAYVYTRNGSMWGSQSKLMAGDGVLGDNFGNAVAISGATIVVGAYRDDTPGGLDAGSAYVFESDIDTTPPSLTVPASIRTEATSSAGAVVTYSVSAIDNVDPNPTIVCAPMSGSVFPIGMTIVNCTATDASNNSASNSFTVNVAQAPPPPPSPTPNPCVASPPPPEGNFRKAIALGAGPALRVDGIGGSQDLLYKYRTTDSPCATDLIELQAESDNDMTHKGDPNILLIKESGTTWVRLWVDWAAIQPYSWVNLAEFQSRSLEELRVLEADGHSAPELRRAARLLINLDGQIRTAHKEKLQVILTLNHRYPLWTNDSLVEVGGLPGQNDEYGPILGCDYVCQLLNDLEFISRGQQPRESFGKVPTNLNAGGPWANWLGFLIERYGLTKNKVDASRQPCSYNFNGEGCGDYFRYVNFLEIVNEPNYTHWPQRNAKNNLIMPLYVARMFRAAKGELDKRNLMLAKSRQFPLRLTTTLKLLGPATADNTDTNARITSYYEFNKELFRRLDSINFRPGKNFAWSHHNYGDVEYSRYGQTKTAQVDPSACDTNSAAWMRQLLRVGTAGYKWEGWPNGDNYPQLLITEGGARLNRLISLYKIAPANLLELQARQALLVGLNFNKMDHGKDLSTGIAMTTNYLMYSDPVYDTGLRDFLYNQDPDNPRLGCDVWNERANCDTAGSGRPKLIPCRDGKGIVPPCVCTGADGKEREAYRLWRTLVPSR